MQCVSWKKKLRIQEWNSQLVSKREFISSKKMCHDLRCHFKGVWLTCVHQSFNVVRFFEPLVPCWILASAENYGRDTHHGMMLVKN